MRSRVETITPEIAAKWLEKNLDNRMVRQAVVDSYARDMRLGKWMLTGDPIRFDRDGVLIDGQHRLWACVESGVTFETYILRGLDPDAKYIIDTGAKRTLGDALFIAHEPNSHLLAGIINICFKMDVDHWQANANPTHVEAMEWLDDNPGARQAASVAYMVRNVHPIAPSPIGAAYYLNARDNGELSEDFWTRAAQGTELKAGDPILAWSRWVSSMLAKRDRPTPRVQFAVHLKAMNLWLDGRTTRIISWKSEDGLPLTWADRKVTRSSGKGQKTATRTAIQRSGGGKSKKK